MKNRILDLDFLLLIIFFIIAICLIPKKTPEIKTERTRIVIVAPEPTTSIETTTEVLLHVRKVKNLRFDNELTKFIEVIPEETESEEIFNIIEIEEDEILFEAPLLIEETDEVNEIIETYEIEDTKEIETNKAVDTPDYKTTFNAMSDEVIVLAKCLEGEAGALKSDMEKAAVIWCVLNRVDSKERYYPDDIIGVVTQQYQFTGYNENNQVRDDLVELVLDVLGRWQAEHRGEENVGRVLPKDYLWFYGLTARNTFRNAYEKDKADYWDWNLPNPYED